MSRPRHSLALKEPLPGEVPQAAAERAPVETPASASAPGTFPACPATPRDIIPLPHVAWERFIAEHAGAVYAYLRARLFSGSDAEDLAQESFLRCYRAGMPEGEAWDQRGWLIGIARNVLREHIRGLERRKEVLWAELCLDLDELAQADGGRAAEGVEDLRECLETLGPSARQALDLRYQDELSLAAIGERLKRSEGAVKLLMFRSRQALRNCLDHKREH